jgi:DNA-binding MarR family transcriptional regulator
MDRLYEIVRQAENLQALIRQHCRASGLRDKQILLLLEIGSCRNQPADAWAQDMPSAAALSAQTGYHRSTVAIILTTLINKGLVQAVRDESLDIGLKYLPVYTLTAAGRKKRSTLERAIHDVELAVFGLPKRRKTPR